MLDTTYRDYVEEERMDLHKKRKGMRKRLRKDLIKVTIFGTDKRGVFFWFVDNIAEFGFIEMISTGIFKSKKDAMRDFNV